MNISREGNYLTLLLGVATASIGLLYLLNAHVFAEMPVHVQMFLVWFSIGVLFMLTGAVDMFEGAQAVVEDFRKRKEEKK